MLVKMWEKCIQRDNSWKFFKAEECMVVCAHETHLQSLWYVSPYSFPSALTLACGCHILIIQPSQLHRPHPTSHFLGLGCASHQELSRCSSVFPNFWVSSWQCVRIIHPGGKLDRALFSRPLPTPKLEASLIIHPLCWFDQWPTSLMDAAPFFSCPLFILCQGQLLLHNFLTQRRILYNI